MSAKASPSPELPSVLLRHTLPDGASHVDWLLAPVGPLTPGERVLKTWRLSETDGLLLAGGERSFECPAIRLPDHRALYLTHEGEVSGGRGEVVRIASGIWTAMSEFEETIDFEVRFGSRWRVQGERTGDAPDPEDRGAPPLGQWKLRFDRTQDREGEAPAATNG